MAAFIYLEPLVAHALAVALLGEPLTAAVVGGGAAILAGVYLVTRPRVTERASAPSIARSDGSRDPS